MKKTLVPSLLSADFSQLEFELHELEESQIHHIHLDVMDGKFVPNISFGPPVIASLREKSSLFFDTHLMVEEPGHLFPALKKAGCNLITIHQEAVRHLHRAIQEIKDLGIQVGVSLNPATPLESLEYVFKDLDLLLLMTVNPGFGGQSFIDPMLRKIKRARQMIDERELTTILEVDGGVKEENIVQIAQAGADWLVAGSAVFQRGKTKKNAMELREILEKNL